MSENQVKSIEKYIEEYKAERRAAKSELLRFISMTDATYITVRCLLNLKVKRIYGAEWKNEVNGRLPSRCFSSRERTECLCGRKA